jgi:hypothetical protein
MEKEEEIFAEGVELEDDFLITIEEYGENGVNAKIVCANYLSITANKKDAWISLYSDCEEGTGDSDAVKFYKIKIKMSKEVFKDLIDIAEVTLDEKMPIQLDLDSFSD